jgi:hypothetical protein
LSRAPRQSLEAAHLNADRKASDAHLAVAMPQHHLPIGRLEHTAARSAVFAEHIAHEISGVAFRLKTDQIVVQQ